MKKFVYRYTGLIGLIILFVVWGLEFTIGWLIGGDSLVRSVWFLLAAVFVGAAVVSLFQIKIRKKAKEEGVEIEKGMMRWVNGHLFLSYVIAHVLCFGVCFLVNWLLMRDWDFMMEALFSSWMAAGTVLGLANSWRKK